MTRIEEIREAVIMGATPASNGTIVIIPNIAAAPDVMRKVGRGNLSYAASTLWTMPGTSLRAQPVTP